MRKTDSRPIAGCVALFAAVLLTGCGDGNDNPIPDVTYDSGNPDVVIQTDTGNDQGAQDVATHDLQDVENSDPGMPDSQFDLKPDEDPPYVVATYPADEETDVPHDFVVRITFNENMREITMKKAFIKLFDINEQEITGTYAYDPVSFTVSFTPDPGVSINGLAPYSVWVSNEVQDTSGNIMYNEYIFRFSTSGPENMDDYEYLAIKYSPIIYQQTDATAPQMDYPTATDFDGDWNAGNNAASYAAASTIPIVVYYDVIETYTHFFIRYHYFYVNHQETSRTYGNDANGVMVVVQKSPEMPIAVETYFGNGSFEDIRSFVTTESGLVKDDDGDTDYNDGDRKNYNANWVFPQSELFPGNHFQNFVTSRSHESCAWIQTNQENALDFKCQLTVASKPGLQIMHFAYTGDTDNNVSAPFPKSNAEGNEIGYELRMVAGDWWVRRDRTGPDDLFSNTTKFEAPEGLLGKNMILPGAFRSTPDNTQGGGKSPWRWSWEPAAMSAYNYFFEFTEGTFYVHPAWYFAKRHRMTLTVDSTGLSGSYCFNPYLLIDKRGQLAECGVLN